MGCCENIEKNLLIFINGFFTIISLATIVCGIWVISDNYLIEKFNLTEFPVIKLIVGVALIASGILSVLLYFAGLWGAIKEITSLLKVYAWILIIGLVFTFVQMIMSYSMFDIKQLSGLEELFKNYNKDKAITSMVDFIQGTLKCCGYNDPEDYKTTIFGKYPMSCCDSSAEYCLTPTYTEGCLYRINDVVTRWQIISFVITFISSILSIICVVAAFRLASKIVKRNTSATLYSKM